MIENRFILLVEDNTDDVERTKKALRDARVLNDVVVMNNGADAWDFLVRATENAPDDPKVPALILLDIQLPKMDGVEVLKRIREHERIKCLPVIILTGAKREEDIRKCYELRANSYICKPVDGNHFVSTIQQVGMYWLQLNELPSSNPLGDEKPRSNPVKG
jgi:two-component system response regulator